VGLKHGFRSGLEEKLQAQVSGAGVPVVYEQLVIPWRLSRSCTYRPDFVLPNGIIIEGKGRFLTSDRQKHIYIKEQEPDLDIRFVFSRSAAPISKTSRTTYADWCASKGFQYADKQIDPRWFREPVNHASLTRIRALMAANKKGSACPF
jgi:hypothetical protein